MHWPWFILTPVMTAQDHQEHARHNIMLVGIMGCGKTTIGREISNCLGLPLVDTDALIEEQEGITINEIFARHGEQHFRDLETRLLNNLPETQTPLVISTGGGIVIRPENRELLRKNGYVVWLNADLDVLFDRISRHSHRPLLHTPDPKGTLRDLLEARKGWYEESSHLAIDSTNLTIPEIVTGIIESSRVYFHQREQQK